MADWFTGVQQIPGWCREEEARLLYRLAGRVSERGAIVEIGSYQGKSTLALIRGSKPRGALVYAIDPYLEYVERDRPEQVFTGSTAADFLRNMVAHNAADRLRVIMMPGEDIAPVWPYGPVDMVYIDANHDIEYVSRHAWTWHPLLKPGGAMAFHDDDIKDVSHTIMAMEIAGYTRIDRQGALTALRKKGSQR